MLNFGVCETIVNKPIIVFQENKSKISFINNQRKKVRKVVVDGCAINTGIRCDFLLITPEYIEYYIELKGSDVNHAVNQVRNSICKLSSNIAKCQKFSFIISTRCPLSSPEIQLLKLKFKKDFNSILLVKNSPASFNL